MSEEKTLIECGQQHLLDATADDTDKRNALIDDVRQFEQSYPNGITGYVKNAKHLLNEAKNGVNPYEGYSVEVPGDNVKERMDSTSAFDIYEEKGLNELSKTAFLLVAGGLGERLGYSSIKIGLPVETISGKSYIQYYCEHIQAYERYIEEKEGKICKLNLIIMVSNDTDDFTRQLLIKNNYFNMEKQIIIMKQDTVPALSDNNAKMVLQDNGKLLKKPHGHGDVHLLMHQLGIAKRLYDHGLKWLCIFQDTNYLSFHALPAAIGVSNEKKLVMNSITVTRKKGDNVGAICSLKKDDINLTINVEYNQLSSLLGGEEKTIITNDGIDTGESIFPGNINCFVLDIPVYNDILVSSHGLVPEFVNPKYADQTKTTFKKPTRLETMMQDLPRCFPPQYSTRVGFTEFPRWVAFSPVKNSLHDAQNKQKNGNEPESASSGEHDLFFYHQQIFKDVGIDIKTNNKKDIYSGIQVHSGPKIICSPDIALSQKHIRSMFPDGGNNIHISCESVIIIEGEGKVEIRGLELNGALRIHTKRGVKLQINQLKVDNKGWKFVEISHSDGDIPEEIKIRGYKLIKEEIYELRETKPGQYSIPSTL